MSKNKELPNIMNGLRDAAISVRQRAVITRETVHAYVDDNGFFWMSAERDPRKDAWLVGRYTHRNDLREICEAIYLRLKALIMEGA